jgi:hypothetical protein
MNRGEHGERRRGALKLKGDGSFLSISLLPVLSVVCFSPNPVWFDLGPGSPICQGVAQLGVKPR